MWTRGKHLLLCGLIAALASPAAASPTDKAFCPNVNIGVPGMGNVPDAWWTAAGGTVTPDDPKWTGSAGHSLASGAASAPVELRASWHEEGGQKYLYLSFQFFVTTTYSSKRALYLAFKTGTDVRVIRLAFDQNNTTGQLQPCGDPDTCVQGYTVFGGTGTAATDACEGIAVGSGAMTFPRQGTTIEWLRDTGRYWSISRGVTPDAWAIQMRIPVVATTTDLHDGVAEGTELAYAAELLTTGGTFHLGRWPRDPGPQQFCTLGGGFPQLWVRDLNAFRPIHILGGGTPLPTQGCAGDVRLAMQDIGFLSSATATTAPTTFFDWSSPTAILGARVENFSTTDIPASTIHGRFRLANWGAQSPAAFTDVALDGSLIPSAAAESVNGEAIPAGQKRNIALSWNITADQKCQYTWQSRASVGWKNACLTCDYRKDPMVDDGNHEDGAIAQGSTAPCREGKALHQCVAVELRGGNIDYENRSSYNNLDFAGLSTSATEAMIDTTGLQPSPGQTEWEVYFIVMPRNMPQSAPAKTMAEIVAEAAAEILARELGGQPAPQPDFNGSVADTHRPHHLIDPIDRWQRLARLAKLGEDGPQRPRPGTPEDPDEQGVPAKDLAYSVFEAFDSTTAAHLIPTLEVYAYYKRDGGPADARPELVPMTSFTLATYHDGPLNGYAWALDGAEHVKGNVYRTRVPVGGMRRIKVEVEAIEGDRATITQDDGWPCGCACGGKTCSSAYQMGNFGLGALVLAWITRRRRPRKPRVAL